MHYPYVCADEINLSRNWSGEFENVVILMGIAVNKDGDYEGLGAVKGIKEDKVSWINFFQWAVWPWLAEGLAGGWR